jgi:putative ABC transport system permease protein
MFKTYLRAAFRHLTKQKVNTLINVSGLALGIAAAIVIVLFARYELTYDQFHKNSENIYLVYKERLTPTGVQPTYDTWVPMLDKLQNDLPEIENGTRLDFTGITIEANRQRFEENCYYVDASYFEVFDFPLAEGNDQKPFPNLNSAVISREMAQKFFGDANPIGREIRVNFEQLYTVSGILEDFPQNSFIGSQILLPIETSPRLEGMENNWGSSFLLTFVTLPEKVSPASVTAKFPALIQSIWNEEVAGRTNFKLLPLHEAYDTFVGDSSESYMLLYIALGIILIAAANYMNLSTARSLLRAREIGMRKILGANKLQLIVQFITEALIITFVALILGVFIAELALPQINALFDMDLFIPYLAEPQVLVILALFGLILGVLAGSYPAFFLSNFKILKSIRSSFAHKPGGVNVRNVLIILQFALSVLLVIGTITIARQLRFMQKADLAFNKENLLVIPVSENDFEDSEEARVRLETFRNEISNHNAVISATTSRHVPGRWSGSNTFVRPEGWEGDPLRMRYTFMDAGFFDTYEIELLDGRGFLPDAQGDQRESVVLNEAAMRAFGWEDIQDKAIVIGDNKIKVVGLIRDFNYETLRSEIDPILHFHRVPSNAIHRYLTLRIAADKLPEAIAFAESKWNILDPSRPFDYFFVEEDLRTMYANEDRLLTMVEVFSFLSIFISCLGLYGLLSFILNRKKKEIGIRKVLGASISNIMVLISREFTKLVLLSFILAVPLAYWFMNGWLKDFAYHITLGWPIFLLTLALLLGIAWLTIFFKSYRAATANPVNAIQEE